MSPVPWVIPGRGSSMTCMLHSLPSGMASVAERVTALALGEQPKFAS